MVFRDQMLKCEKCGKRFFFTVTEQRRIAERLGTDQVVTPTLCQQCAAQETQPQAEPIRSQPVPEPVRSQPVPGPEPRSAPPVVEAAAPLPEPDFPLQEGGIEVKLIGTVKWFSREKGYGFVTKADGTDLFFHRADLARDQHVLPREGQQIEFQVRQTVKGPEAFNVSLLPTD